MDSSRPDVVVLEAAAWAEEPGFATAVHSILSLLVTRGAALGWLDPPPLAEVAELLAEVEAAAAAGDASLCAAFPLPVDQGSPSPARLLGLGYWLRYERPTHRVNADARRIAVAPQAQGRGVGRAVTQALIDSARRAGIETLTLDVRGDNAVALRLYRDLGFTEYGRLKDFVAFGDRRYDKVLCCLDLRPPHAPTTRV